MKFRWYLPVLIFLVGLLPLRAETMNLTLQQAIQKALAKNFRIKVEQFAPRIAKAQQMNASGEFDPILQASYTYTHSEQELRTLNGDLNDPVAVPGQVVPDLFARQDGQEISTTVTGILPTGTSYTIGPSLTMNTSNQRNPAFTEYNTFFGVSLTQPLLKNFGTDVNLANIRVARANQAISQWQLRQQVIDVVTDTISIYSELYFSIQNVEAEKRSRALAAQLVEDNTKREQGGVMISLDVMQAKADLADRDERVLVAERAVADNENFLKQLVTDEIAGILDVRIDIVEPELADTADPDRKSDYARAFDLRPDYRQALLNIQKQQINIVFTRNQTLPQLDLVGSLGLNGIDTSFLSSAERVSGNGNRNLSGNIGGVFSLPVPNRTARGNLEASKLQILQSLVDLKRLEQSILVEADNAAGQIETTRKRIEAASLASEFAGQTLKAAQARLDSGRSTTFEVLQFQRDLADAEVNEARARADFIKALAQYARTIGSTLERNGITLE